MDRGVNPGLRANNVTFGEMAARWKLTRADLAASTKDRDESYLRSLVLPAFRDRPVKLITASEIETWLANLEKSDWTRNKALQILKSVLELARRDGLVDENKARDVRSPSPSPKREGRALSDGELGRIIQASEQVDPSTAAMVVLMARCGLRVGEAIALRREDIDFDRGMIALSHSMSRREGLRPLKGRSTSNDGRTIPMPKDVEDRLRRHIAGRQVANLSGYVFSSPGGYPIHYNNWRRRGWAKITEVSGIDAVTHDLQHSTATRLFIIDRWVPAEVQAIMGHRDPRTTQRIYVHVNSADLPRPSELQGSA